jgi:regulator of sirC expression with transglutaminase-like and TPR domain
VTYDTSKINGLIQLLDDPDENIFTQIRDEFEIIGIEAIPVLEEYWENSSDSLAVKRAENLIHSINSKEVREQLKTWVELGGKNLLKGSILVAKCHYHNLNEDKVTSTVNQIKQDIWIELNDNLTALEKIQVVNKVMFNIHGFEGNREDYYAPKNSFINKALDNKAGTPLSIGLLYAVICQGLDIPVYGVNLPHHFVLAYQDDSPLPIMDDSLAQTGILFYINPFNHGSVFGKPEVNDFLLQNNIEPEDKYFVPCTNLQIVKRMINNLVVAFEKTEKPEKVDLFKSLLTLFR